MPQIIKRLDVKLVSTQREGQHAIIDIAGLGSKVQTVKGSCPPGETIVGGGWSANNGDTHYSGRPAINPNEWWISATYDGDGVLGVMAECLKAELSLKGGQ
jgi:hypothetical protein